jgi:hypothetical protein
MKKFILMGLILLLAACSEVTQEVIDAPLEEETEVVEDSSTPTLLELIETVDTIEHWQQVVSQATSYMDFRFQGCVNRSSLQPIECRKYDWRFGEQALFHSTLYYADEQSIMLRQLGNDGMNRDLDYLQAMFVGELIGLLPATLRSHVIRAQNSNQADVFYADGVLTYPNFNNLEANASMMRDFYIVLYDAFIEMRVDVSEIEVIVNKPISLIEDRGTPRNRLSETYMAYYFQTVTEGSLEFFDETTYQRLDELFHGYGLAASLVEGDKRLDVSTLPAHYVLYVDSGRDDLLPVTSPSALDEITYRGIETHRQKDRRQGPEGVYLIPHPYHSYTITYIDDDTMEMFVNSDISKEEADAIVSEVSYFYGQLPLLLRQPLNFVTVQPGTPNILLSPGGYVFHLDFYQMSGRSMQHFLVHELAHISMDWAQALNFPDTGNMSIYYELSHSPISGEEWIAASQQDITFITQYARDYPFIVPNEIFGYQGGEDLADTLVFYIVSRLSPESVHPKLLRMWETAIGHRFAIFDELDFSLPPRGRLSQ